MWADPAMLTCATPAVSTAAHSAPACRPRLLNKIINNHFVILSAHASPGRAFRGPRAAVSRWTRINLQRVLSRPLTPSRASSQRQPAISHPNFPACTDVHTRQGSDCGRQLTDPSASLRRFAQLYTRVHVHRSMLPGQWDSSSRLRGCGSTTYANLRSGIICG